jgi:probable HAF family extracellular repeat protein
VVSRKWTGQQINPKGDSHMKNVSFRCPFAGMLAASALFAQTAAAQAPAAQPMHYTVTDLGIANGNTPGQPFAIKNDGLMAGAASVSIPSFASAWHATLYFLGMQIDLANTGGLSGLNSSAFAVNEFGQAVGEAETQASDPHSEDFCGFGTLRGCTAFSWQNGVLSALPMLKDAKGAAGHNAAAKAINILGQVAGLAENTTPDSTCPTYNPSPTSLQFQTYQFKPVLWADSEIQPLATSGVDASGKPFNDPDGAVFSMNDRGQAVGATGTCTGYTSFLTYLNSLHATLWEDGFLIDLGNLGGVVPGIGNFAYDINRAGHVVGTSGTSDGSFHAFFWSPATRIQDLGTVAGDVASVGLAIDDAGDTGGVSFPADPNASPRAFIRPEGGAMVDLNTLIPANSELYLFSVCSINSRGEIIGLAFDSQGNFHGYLATPTSTAAVSSEDLPTASRTTQFESAWSLLRGRPGLFGMRRH